MSSPSEPVDEAAWEKLFSTLLAEGEYDRARHAAERSGPAAPRLLAEHAIVVGKPETVGEFLKGDRSPAALSLRGWAEFAAGNREAAARNWAASEVAEERSLAEILLSFSPKTSPSPVVVSLLRAKASGAGRFAASVAAILLAEAADAAGDPRRTLSWARRAAWILPRLPLLRRLAARAAEKSGDPLQARKEWESLLAFLPEDAEALEFLGRAELAEKHPEAARDLFRRALASDPSRGHLRILLGDIALELGADDEAWELFDAARLALPTDRTALSRMGEIAWDRGDVTQALDLMLQVGRLGVPEDEEEELLEISGYLMAETLLSGESSHRESVGPFFEKALGKFKDNLFLRVYRARCAIALESYAEAEEMIDAILRKEPLLPEALFEKGHIHSIRGDMPGAIKYMTRATESDADPFYKKELGKLFLDMGDWRAAERVFKAAISTGVDDDDAHFGLYASFYYQSKFTLAENVLRRILKIYPENAQAAAYLAELLMILDRREEAWKWIEEAKKRALSLDEYMAGKGDADNVVEPQGILQWIEGFLAFRSGEWTRAAGAFREAMAVAPDVGDWNPVLANEILKSKGWNEIPFDLARSVRELLKP